MPKRKDEVRVSVALEAAVRERLKDIAWATGRSLTGVVEDAVIEVTQKQWQRAMDQKLASISPPGE